MFNALTGSKNKRAASPLLSRPQTTRQPSGGTKKTPPVEEIPPPDITMAPKKAKQPNPEPPAAEVIPVIPNNGYGENSGYGEKHDHHDHHEHSKYIEEESRTTIIQKSYGKSITEIETETRVDYSIVTEEIIALLTIGEVGSDGTIIRPSGDWFLEEIITKLKVEIIERWKIEFLFPAIRIWIGKYILEYIEKLVRITREKIIREFEEKILIIEIEHRRRCEEIERCNREKYCEGIKRCWSLYEEKMKKIEFVKEIRFKYEMKEEREIQWAEMSKELCGDLCDDAPHCFEPDFSVFDGGRHRPHINH